MLPAPMFHVEAKGDHVRLLRMDDAKVNAIGPEFIDAFGKAWADATRDGRAVVVAGNAKAFSAGLNLKVLPALERAEMVAFAQGFMRLFGDVLAYDRPVVAAVDGPALAGGAVLALAADFRVVSPRARLGLTEVPVGIPFPAAVVALARAKLPVAEWPHAVLRGGIREGAHCLQHGWAQELHASERVVEAAVALAAELGEHNPAAYAPAKRGLVDDVRAAFGAFSKDGAERWIDELTSEDTIAAILRGFERATRK